jgi:hypothetical protein
MGVPPVHTTYLYASAICANSGDDEEKMRSRFLDNAVFHDWGSAYFFASLGLPYKDNNRRVAKGEDKPFALILADIVEIGPTMKSTQTGEELEVSTIYFANICGRRADFLFERQASRDILNEAVKRGQEKVPADCRKWFTDKFPSDNEDRVPIIFGQRRQISLPDEYAIWDLKTGEKFSKIFHADGTTHFLAIWSHRLKKFVDEATESSFTHGAKIELLPSGIKSISEIKGGYKQVHDVHVRKSRIGVHAEIPIFGVTVEELSQLVDGEWQLIDPSEYRHDAAEFRPSRGIHAIIDFSNVRLGHVAEVPPRPGKGSPPTRRKMGKGEDNIKSRWPYCQRDPRIAVRWDDANKFLELNTDNPVFRMLYDAPDQIGSPSQKPLQDLYWSLHAIAAGTAAGVSVGQCDHTPHTASKYVDDDEQPIYDPNRWDYVVNKAIERFMADSYFARYVIEQVRICRSRNVA